MLVRSELEVEYARNDRVQRTVLAAPLFRREPHFLILVARGGLQGLTDIVCGENVQDR
jgi:hypothetical protein